MALKATGKLKIQVPRRENTLSSSDNFLFASVISELVNIRQLRTKQMALKATGKLKIKVPRRENTIIFR
jgi:hypothetical protein